MDAPGVDDYTGSGLIQVDAAAVTLIEIPATEAPLNENEPEEEDSSKGQGAPLPSPTSSGLPLPVPTLPASTPTEPEVSAQQSIVGTPTVQIITSSTAGTSVAKNSSNSIPSFLIGVLTGVAGILIFLWLKRK